MSNVNKMRKMYIEYPILQTLSAKLTWSHYVELLKIDDPLERSFYEKQAENENWGVRELKRQRSTLLFQRMALSTDKDSVMKLAQKGRIIEKPEDILKEPFVFEFTGLPQLPTYSEGDTEPIGIVLGTERDKLVMKYALQNITNQVFVSRYQLYMPDKDELEAEFRRYMGTGDEKEEIETEDNVIKLSILVIDSKQYIPSYNWYFRKSDGCIYGTANSPDDICYDEVRLTIFESSDDFVLMPECPGMTDEEAAEVVKEWCAKNNIRFIDDMDNIEETYRAMYM